MTPRSRARVWYCGMPRSGSTWQFNVGWALSPSTVRGKFHVFPPGSEPILETMMRDDISLAYIHRDVRYALRSLVDTGLVDQLGGLEWYSREVVDHHHKIIDLAHMDEVLVQRYGELMRNPQKQALELALWLGVAVPLQKVVEIAHEWSLGSLEKNVEEHGDEWREKHALIPNHISKHRGDRESWEEGLTRGQRKTIERAWEKINAE